MRVSNIPLYTGVSSEGIPSIIKKKIKCSYCHKVVMVPISYRDIKSDFDKAQFCSYNCRCAYYKEHEKERERAEVDRSKEYNERRKIKYQNDPEFREKSKERSRRWFQENKENGMERKKRNN